MLAGRLGISAMTFINRYKDPSPEDYGKLKAILVEMRADLNSVYREAEKIAIKNTLHEFLEQVDSDKGKYGPEVVDKIIQRIREQNAKPT